LLFRRPLDKALADQVVARSVDGANELHDFYGGLAVALEGLLMAPQALFVADRAKPDPARPGYARLDAFSLASRLSFFLWNAAPDDELLRAAEKGELDSASGLAKTVDRMLASPGSRRACALSSTTCCASTISRCCPRIPASTRPSAPKPSRTRASTLRTLVDQLLVRKLDYRDLFTSRDTFISPSLAVIYDVAAPPGWTPSRARPTTRARGC
jgi:hypothetical protein